MKKNKSLSDENAVLKELKELLTGFLGESLIKFVLFGSRARGGLR